MFSDKKSVIVRQPYNLFEHASVQNSFGSPALPQLVVIVVETLPVISEEVQALFIDVFQPEINEKVPRLEQGLSYTLAAHLVTFLPSFIHSSSPRP